MHLLKSIKAEYRPFLIFSDRLGFRIPDLPHNVPHLFVLQHHGAQSKPRPFQRKEKVGGSIRLKAVGNFVEQAFNKSTQEKLSEF
ncbi:MAG: hypothetical protein KIC46_07575 [Clostridiales bacterium]|nr:hypothetical protein [Clostridiales bacterium]